jgi:peptidoglycan hydrolase-like protein with peptidoglycan-binding domain
LYLPKAVAVLAAGLICSAAVPPKASAPTKSAPKKAVAVRHRKRATHTAKKTPARSARRSVPVQMQPTPERYKQFQEALIKKGYLKGEATGTWDAASADAMRRFQRDQNLEPTGKPDQSLTIIALGLGPKY